MTEIKAVENKETEKHLSVRRLKAKRIELSGEIAKGEQKRRELEIQLGQANDSITFLRGAVAMIDDFLSEE